MLYRSGLRISEALELRPKDVDPAAGSIRVLFAKGGKDRTAGIDAGAAAIVAEWAAARSALSVNGVHPLFCSMRGNRLTGGYVRRLMRRLGGARAGEGIGIGAGLAARPLPHHRAYGSVHGGSSGHVSDGW